MDKPGHTEKLRELDKQYLWHPFTQMKDWTAPEHDPLVIVSGNGSVLRDSEGNEYLDGNSSIWTNIHGHGHPHIDAAIKAQVEKLAHCSALGYTNEPAILLAEKLVSLFPDNTLSKVFFTDDGSTAIECACKMAIQYHQLTGSPERTRFISFDNAYHGDTAGAASLGGIGTFKGRFHGMGFDAVSLPGHDHLDSVEVERIAAVCIEPLIQGAAGMQLWPKGILRELREWCDKHGVLLVFDEVMTGFGRTGKLFACEHERVIPDFLCLAKGLTGGYLPLAATLTTNQIYKAFLGGYEETFFYGHSYCGNPLGCAAALASLEVLENENVIESLPGKIVTFREAIKNSFTHFRQLGLIAGIDIEGPSGHDVCIAARKYGLLTRPIRDTLVLMPPLCSTTEQIEEMVSALYKGFHDLV